MASSVAIRKGRKHKMRLLTDNNDDQMVVKSLSVPPGLEALMEGLTREVLRMQPQDICLFASEHFAKLIKMREATGDEYQFCKTTIHDKIKQNTVPSRVTTQPNQQPSLKDDVETFDGTSASALAVPRLDFGRLTNGVSPEIKRGRSEASTAEIDKLQGGFFDAKPTGDTQITESNEHVNTDDEIVNNKDEENGTITGGRIKENKAEPDDMKDIKSAEHDDNESNKTEEKDDSVAKEVNVEELAKGKENVESNRVEEDNAKKENQIQGEEETKDDKEICDDVETDAVTKESTEIPNEEGNVKQNEDTSKEVTVAHDGPEKPETINITTEVNKENLDNIQEAKMEHLATTDTEVKLNETEKKETGNQVEDGKHPEEAESKLEAVEEHDDDLSDSNDVVTQEPEQEMKTLSPADKVQISPVEENTNDGSSVEDKPVQSSVTEVEHLEDSTEAKLGDEKHEGQEEDNSTENESPTDLEKAVINDNVTEKDSNKTPVHNTQVEDVQTDGVHNLTVPEISTTVATPTPSEDGSTSGDNVPKELDENVNPTGDDNAAEEEKQIKAATRLQSLWRGYSLRKTRKSATVNNAGDNEETSEDVHKLTTAATVIQALWRGYSFRKAKATEGSTDEAENITADEISPDKETRDVTDEQNIAATKIQSSWRGHNVRKKRHIDMNDIASDEEHDKTICEVKPSAKVVENELEDKGIAKEIMAATVIQALWRGYAMRKSGNLESENESTQRSADVDIGKLNVAAAKIQSLWRGHNYRKLNSTVVAEMPVKEMEKINETRDDEKEEATHTTTADSELDAESKTDTNISESDEPKAEKVTEVTEPAVETEKANVTESEHVVQSSDSEVNAKQDSAITELGTEKVNDTIEPEIEAEKANEVESGNIPETKDSGENIEGVAASSKSDLEDEKTADASEYPEEVDSVSKTDADVPESQNKTAESDKTSDENNETIKITDASESEIKSEEVSETVVPFAKAEEIVKTEEAEIMSEKHGDKTEPAVKADETEDEVKSEEVVEKTESIVKEDEIEVKSEEVAEPTEPIVKADDTEVKSENVDKKTEPVIKAEELVKTDEDKVKSEEDAEKTESTGKTNETEGEIKSEKVSQTSEAVMKADEVEPEIKSEEVVAPVVQKEINVETAEPKIKSDEVTETPDSVVKPGEIIKATKTEGETKSENIVELAEHTESKDLSKTTENDVKPGEISEPEVKDEKIADKVEPSVVDETTEIGEPFVSDKDAPETTNSSTTAEEVTDLVKSDSTVVEPKEIANIPVLKTNEINETTASEAKENETEKTVESEMDPERNENGGAPVVENIKQELVEKVESSPTGTENENSPVEKTELNSDKEFDSAGTVVKNAEETHAIENNVNELDETKTTSDNEKISETNDNDKEKFESAIIPGSASNTLDTDNVKVKNADISDKTVVEISVESPENTTITTPSEDPQSEVEHVREVTKNNDNLSSESPEMTVSDAAAENKKPESTITTDERLKEPSTTMPQDSSEEKSTKLDESIDVEPIGAIVEDNSEQSKLTNSSGGTDNEETNKDVSANTDGSDIPEPRGTKNTESDTNEQTDTEEHVTETLNHHLLDETQVDEDKRDEITEPEIKKESVEAAGASPSKQEENETEITNDIVTDKSSEDQKMNETDGNSTNESVTDIIKDDNPSEAADSSEVSNENTGGIISELEEKSADDKQSLMKTENTDHVDAGTEISNNGASAIEAKLDGKAGQEDSVKENDAATKIQSSWRGHNVRKSTNTMADVKDPETKSENENETEENVEKSSEDTGSKTETNEGEITKPIVDTAEKAVEELGTAEENVNESLNADETVAKVENVPDEAAKENIAVEISEPVVEKIEHSSVNSENVNEAGINDASEINKEETVVDSSSTDENKLEDTVTNHEAVPATKTAEVEKAEHDSDLIRCKEDTGPAKERAQQETTEKSEETSSSSTDNKAENAESSDKLDDDLEKHVETTNGEHDAKMKEDKEVTDTADSSVEDHKDTYQASEASTVDIRDVEDSLKSPVHAEDGNDLEINVHEDGEKLNESSDTKNSPDADGKVTFYVGPDETNHIQIVDDVTEEAANHVNENTESDKLTAGEATNENNREIQKSTTSVLLSALTDDPEELEKDAASKEINDAKAPESDQCIDGKKITPADEEHQNDDLNNATVVNPSVPNAEEDPTENIDDEKENTTENAQAENINETQDNQAQNSIDNNTETIENHSVKSHENVSNIKNDKLDANHDDDKEKLAMNIQSFDKALSESQNKEKESKDVELDKDNVEDVTDKGDTEDTTLVADTQNAPTIPLVHDNTEKTTDTVGENNTATETVDFAPLAEEQHAVNSENKSDSVQNEDSDLSPTNLHEDKPSESATNDSNDVESTQDTVESIITPVEQHENTKADEATTHSLLNTTAKDISHKSDSMSPSDIIEEGTHAADNGNNEHDSEETHEESHTPVPATAEDLEIPHELENESPVNNEDKHTVDEVDNVPENVEHAILHASVGTTSEDMPHESESKSSVSVNDADENKNKELNETHTPFVTITTEENQNESNKQMEHLEEKDTDKDIEEKESEKLDETTIVPSREDEGNKNSEDSEENIKNDITENSDKNGHAIVDRNISDVEPASQDISVDDKENEQIDTTKDKDAKENINEDNTGEKNENNLIPNEENHSAVHDMKEENRNEDKPEAGIKINDIESQIEHDITDDDDAETKQNDEATENAASLEKEVETCEENNEKHAAVKRDDNQTEADKAAVKIQSTWKGYHVRQGLNEDKELVSLQRPAECEELPSKTDVVEDADIQSRAATTIQAGARGYLVRKRRHLAKVTEVPSAKADATTVDESDSTSQDTVVEKQADTPESSQSFGSIENAKSEEENEHDGTPKEEAQTNEEESKSTITPEGTKDVESNNLDADKSKADGESIMETRNDKTNGTDVMKETKDKEKENIAESKHESSAEISKSVEETTNNNDKQELDEIGALNLRLRNLSRTNVYQTEEEKESDDKMEDDHKTDSPKAMKMNFDRVLSDLHAQTFKSSDDDESVMTAPSNTDDNHNSDANKPDDDKELETKDEPSQEVPDADNKEVAQILTKPKANATPRLSVNLDDFDSSKYDLKVEHASPRSKNTSPVHELTSAAYKIGAAIAVDDEAIVDAMDENAKDKKEEKPVEYIHIPLQGPLPKKAEEKPMEKETLTASQGHVTSDTNKDDGESPEYIYIPLKPPGTVEEDDGKVGEGSVSKENMGNVDNRKEETINETGPIPRSPTENKDDNEEKLSVSEHEEHLETKPIAEKEDNADKSNDTRAILEDKEKEDNNSKLEEHDLSGKETLADHVIEKECDNETEQITKIPEAIPLMNKPSEQELSSQPLLAMAKSSELELFHSKSPEPTHSGKLDEKSPQLELSESQPADSIVSEEPVEKLTAKRNLEKSPVSETKTPKPELSEYKSSDSIASAQSTENLTTEKDTAKSVVDHTSADSELSENKSAEMISSEMKNAEPELSDNPGIVDLLSESKASDALLSAKSKSPEVIDAEQGEKSKEETSRIPSPVKPTSAIADIDAFLQRNKSRTISRQPNVDSSSHRTLFAEIDSLIDAYGQKRQMSPTSNGHPDLASAKIENESRAQGQQLSVQDDLPDVIMANSNGAELAATKIQSAYRGYHTRQQLKQGLDRLEEAQPRKDSSESDKTYTIAKHSQDNESTPDEALSDEDGLRNKAATKIQTTFREYRKKRSTDEQDKSVDDEKIVQGGEEKHVNEISPDEITDEPVELSNKMSEDKNEEIKGSIDNSENQRAEQQHTTSVVDVNDESVQRQASDNTLEVTTHNTDAQESVANESTADSLEMQQPYADYDSLNSEQEIRHSPERGQVQDLKITQLEDKFLDHVVTNDSGTDAKHEQLKDISEITHDAATKIQSTYRGFKTRQTLKTDNQLDRPLDTIPEVMSPTSLDVNKEHESPEHGKKADEDTMNEEEHDHAHVNGAIVQKDLKSSGDVDVLSESSRQKSAEHMDKLAHDVASISDEWRYRLLHDATTDETSSGLQSDSTIHAEDDSESYARASSPAGKLVHGTPRQNAEHPAGLQHSGEMHDTLDIFLSSEELSQGAEVLTSRDTSTTDDVSSAHAQSGSAAKHEGSEQHDVHSVMESAKNQDKNNTPTIQHNEQQQQQQHEQQQQQQQQTTVTDMGNDEAVAATKIQAGFRGYQVRKQMKLKKNGSDDARMVKRCSSGRRRGSLRRGENAKSGSDLEELSATKIQAGIRGFLVRKRQKSSKQ